MAHEHEVAPSGSCAVPPTNFIYLLPQRGLLFLVANFFCTLSLPNFAYLMPQTWVFLFLVTIFFHSLSLRYTFSSKYFSWLQLFLFDPLLQGASPPRPRQNLNPLLIGSQNPAPISRWAESEPLVRLRSSPRERIVAFTHCAHETDINPIPLIT